jgi:hypothetical protein
MSDWELEDAAAQAAAHPRAYFIPDEERRRAVQVGDDVRLSFLLLDPGPHDPHAERTWVTVVERDGDTFVGTLIHDPVAFRGLKAGDRVTFGPEHVNRLEKTTPWDGLGAYVTVRLLGDDSLEPEWVLHDPGGAGAELEDGLRSSGWELHAPGESEEEADDDQAVALGWLVLRYPEFGELAASGAADGSWTRDPATGRYVSDAQTINATDT